LQAIAIRRRPAPCKRPWHPESTTTAERCLSGNNPELRRVFTARRARKSVGAVRAFAIRRSGTLGADSSAQPWRERVLGTSRERSER